MKTNVTKTVSNGVEIPLRGFGVYQIADHEEVKRTVLAAIQEGYRLIDTARAYGNEEAVGEAVRESGVDRSELFITTKMWTTGSGYENAKKEFYASLERLQMDYVDMYLIHEPMGDYYGSWRAIEELYKEGKIRVIGICNMWPDRLLDFCLNVEIPPQVVQIETHPFQHQNAIQPVMKQFNIVHQAWGPFAEGREGIFDPNSSNYKHLEPIAKAHGKSVAQVILRWLYQRDIVSLCKSVKPSRIKENFDILDFELSDAEMARFDFLNHERPLILNNRDLEVVARISPSNFKK